MAVTNAFFIPSLSLQRSAIGEFGHGFPRFTTTKSLPISPAFFPCRSTLSTKLTLQATPDCTNSVGSTSFGAQESRELKSHGSFHLARLFIRPGERVSSWRTTSSDFRLQTFMSDVDSDPVPMPIVLIDQDTDPVSTIVQLSFGDRLGALIDTMKALKDLGLDVLKGTVSTEGAIKQTKLFITRLDTGRKVEDPDMLERIRLTVIDNLLKYHPESSERLAMGKAFGIKAPVKPDVDVATHIHVQEDGPKRSLLCIETADRPGLLMEIIKIMADINVDVESAEIDTEGLVAKDKFHVSYRGAALNSSLSQVLVNCLRYYLRRPQTDEDSY